MRCGMDNYKDVDSYEKERIRIIKQLEEAKIWAEKMLHVTTEKDNGYDATIRLLKYSKWAGAGSQEVKPDDKAD